MKSWVIVEKGTQKAIFETHNENLKNTLNTDKYEMIPIRKYLEDLNEKIRQQTRESHDV